MFKKCFKIKSKYGGFSPMQKLGEGWAKFSRFVMEFNLDPNMWYNLRRAA